jgi:hypothetical protein
MNKIYFIIIIAVLILGIGGGSFYGGMVFEKSSNKRFNFEGMGVPNGFGGANNTGKQQGNGSAGEIISKDEQSITIKLTDGGSKIVFVSDSAEISKYASGSIADLAVGENVMVQGTANSDGSITAKTIQIRPAVQKPAELQNQQK